MFSLLHSEGGIGGLSVRVGGVALGIDGTKPFTESRSVFCVMLKTVVEMVKFVQITLCWSVCLGFNQNLTYKCWESLSVCWKAPLSLSSCSARQRCRNTSLPETQQTSEWVSLVCLLTYVHCVSVVWSSLNWGPGHDVSVKCVCVCGCAYFCIFICSFY